MTMAYVAQESKGIGYRDKDEPGIVRLGVITEHHDAEGEISFYALEAWSDCVDIFERHGAEVPALYVDMRSKRRISVSQIVKEILVVRWDL